jgi:hypothetical protein
MQCSKQNNLVLPEQDFLVLITSLTKSNLNHLLVQSRKLRHSKEAVKKKKNKSFTSIGDSKNGRASSAKLPTLQRNFENQAVTVRTNFIGLKE